MPPANAFSQITDGSNKPPLLPNTRPEMSTRLGAPSIIGSSHRRTCSWDSASTVVPWDSEQKSRYSTSSLGASKPSPSESKFKDTDTTRFSILSSETKVDDVPSVEKGKVQSWEYLTNIVADPVEGVDVTVDMDPSNNTTKMLYTGKLLMRNNAFLWGFNWEEVMIVLFDSHMVITKLKHEKGRTTYHLYSRPMSLDFLEVVHADEASVSRSSGLWGCLDDSTRMVYPLRINRIGHASPSLILYCESKASHAAWEHELSQAIAARRVAHEPLGVFKVVNFIPGEPSSHSKRDTIPPWRGAQKAPTISGTLTCMVHFDTSDGRELVACGSTHGLWIGYRYDLELFQRVSHLKSVTQCDVLTDSGILLALGDNSLYAYRIEGLLANDSSHQLTAEAPHKLSGDKKVDFFKVGQVDGRLAIVYVSSTELHSVFCVLDTVADVTGSNELGPLTASTWLQQRPWDWFRVYREFYLPLPCHDIAFLKSFIVAVSTDNFETVTVSDLSAITLIGPSLRKCLIQRMGKKWKSLGLFPVSAGDEYLVCFDGFGIYIDRHGKPSREKFIVEWDSNATSVSLHYPHILLFNSQIVEVRHVHTGKLVQVIRGDNLRCLWARTPRSTYFDSSFSIEPRVYGAMTAPREANSQIDDKAPVDLIFRLVPNLS